MDEAAVKAWLEEHPDEDASDLLDARLPGILRKLRALDKRIAAVLADVREAFPSAEYYTAGGDGFALLLGNSHDSRESPQHDLLAFHGLKARIGGGDW